MKTTAKENDAHNIFANVSVTPVRPTIMSAFAIELQWSCSRFLWSVRRKLAVRSLQFNFKCTDNGSRSYRNVCKNVCIVFFGHYFHYKAIQRFYFSCTNSLVGSAMCPECPTKNWWSKSCWPKSTGKWPRGRPRPRWSDYISDFAWSYFGVEPAESFESAVDRQVFQILLGCCSFGLP